MKKYLFTVFLVGTILIVGCKKEKEEEITPEEETTETTEEAVLNIETSPSAKVEDDNKSSGVYKGAFVGSTGSFKLTLETDNITGTLVVDGVTYNLSTTDITNSDLGSALSGTVFTDSEGIVTLTFSVDADGQNPTATLTITGHSNIEVLIAKETSTNQVKTYEGLLYYGYGDTSYAYQCVFTANTIIKGTSGTTSVTYKFSHDNEIQGTSNCDANDYGTSSNYEYTISGTNINMFQYVSECDTCPQWTEGFLGINENGTITEDELIFTNDFPWTTAGGITLQDSLHFYRKL